MTRTLFRIFVITTALLLEVVSAHAGSDRYAAELGHMVRRLRQHRALLHVYIRARPVDSGSMSASFATGPGNADPLLRITTNTPLADDGEIRFIVDGKVVDTLPVAELRDIQASVVSPEGFRPIGGEGFWYPAGQATRSLLEKMGVASQLVIELPMTPEKTVVTVELGGLSHAISWIDARQNRIGTASSITSPGPGENKDAPHAVAHQQSGSASARGPVRLGCKPVLFGYRSNNLRQP